MSYLILYGLRNKKRSVIVPFMGFRLSTRSEIRLTLPSVYGAKRNV